MYYPLRPAKMEEKPNSNNYSKKTIKKMLLWRLSGDQALIVELCLLMNFHKTTMKEKYLNVTTLFYKFVTL